MLRTLPSLLSPICEHLAELTTYTVIIPLYPEEGEAHTLDGQSRICNWLYNQLVQQSLDLRQKFVASGDSEIGKQLYSTTGLRDLIPDMKQVYEHLQAVHSSPLKNVGLRLSAAIRQYQQAKKQGKKAGWPKFRAWGRQWFSLLYDEPNKGFKVVGSELRLSLGMDKDGKRHSLQIPMGDNQVLRGVTIRTLRIIKKGDRYYALFTVQRQMPAPKAIQRCIALDPNHKNMAYGVDLDGKAIEIRAPRWLKVYEHRLDELQQLRDRCKRKAHKIEITGSQGEPLKGYWKPSRRWQKLQNTYQRAQHKRQAQTLQFMRQLAHRLFREYDLVGMGDYTPQGDQPYRQMRRSMFNGSLIGRFKEVLAWVAHKSGKHFHEYNERGTTRTCHDCHYVVDGGLEPRIRQWTCPCCKAHHHRDENAGRNGISMLLQEMGLTSLLTSKTVTVASRWLWQVTPLRITTAPVGPLQQQKAS